MDSEIASNLVLFVLLIAMTGFFVATEFAIVKVRQTRIDQLITEGNRKAIKAKKVLSHLDEYLSACQLGITITALGLGWIGEPTAHKVFTPLMEMAGIDGSLAKWLSFAFAFAVVTFAHVVIGELAPKTFAIEQAEKITLRFAGPLIIFHIVTYPLIKILNGSARVLTSLFGLKLSTEHEEAHSEEELRMILSDSYKSGEINPSEYKLVNRIFEFDERIAKEIMIPRTEMIGFNKETTLNNVFELMNEEQYTRYPVMDGDKDHVIGIVNMKHLLSAIVMDAANGQKTVEEYMQPVIRIIDTVPINSLLLKFQRESIHMAILLDEYGGTSGLVTIEDVIEEIVGDIRDEFDEDEEPEIQKVADGHFKFNGKVLLEQVNSMLGVQIDEEDIDTIGGWFMSQHDNIKEGVFFEKNGFQFIVKEVNKHQIIRVEAKKVSI
ncbi:MULTISPECIES: hemolysin family protein [Rummeliibacillus]|uniref:hemolysin family protein n=1 Tax=Rummeliibacillus TaxID=648802 RepID=UPI001171FB98|nr:MULTISPECIES: hemolysin family protein [Rummeliibacillus]MBB5168938.1 CBS domain containing-hemolysin-like protein [Rummeliibacillus stabekisii]GEL05579.1 membrane protein [Rummeliibacillus stabekisii]